jgi:hypothetical protein
MHRERKSTMNYFEHLGHAQLSCRQASLQCPGTTLQIDSRATRREQSPRAENGGAYRTAQTPIQYRPRLPA